MPSTVDEHFDKIVRHDCFQSIEGRRTIAGSNVIGGSRPGIAKPCHDTYTPRARRLHMKNGSEAKAGLRLEEVVSQGDVAHFC